MYASTVTIGGMMAAVFNAFMAELVGFDIFSLIERGRKDMAQKVGRSTVLISNVVSLLHRLFID